MDFESPDVAKEFPGLYASESMKRSQSRDSDYSDEEKSSRKDLLGKKKDKKESKKDKGYVAFEGESSGDELDEARSPGKSKKSKSSTFKFPGKDKKEKHSKSKDKDTKDKKEDKMFKKEEKEKEKVCKKESKEVKKESKDADKVKIKKKKESKLLKIKDRKKKSITQEEDKPIFGVPLQIAVERSKSYDGIELPVIVRECIDYIEEHGLACEGIYKISGLKSKLQKLKSQYNRGEKVYLYEHEPHIVASLLKLYLRDLPEPILTSALASKFEEAAALKNEHRKVEALQKLMNELPVCNRLLLTWIFIHMQHVMSMEKRNKMNLQNVSIVLSPTLQISHNVLQALFAHSNTLFRGVDLKKYVPPIELDSTRLSLELPDSPSAIAKELSNQESILNVLHTELNSGLRDQQKEEQLWEIQRVVTQLKRKLRFLRQVQDTSQSRTEDETLQSKSDDEIGEVIVNATILDPPCVTICKINKAVSQGVTEKEPPIGETKPSEIDASQTHPNKDNFAAKEIVKAEKISAEPEVVLEDINQDKHLKKENTNIAKLSFFRQVQDTSQFSSEDEILLSKSDDEIGEVIVNATILDPPCITICKVYKAISQGVTEKETPIGQIKHSEHISDVAYSKKPEVINKIEEPVNPENEVSEVSPATEFQLTDDENIYVLIHEEKMLHIEYDELQLLGDELRRKINSEKLEIDRLKMEINEYQQLYKYKRYSFDSTENSSSDSDDSSASDYDDDDDDEDLSTILDDLMSKNKQLEVKNKDASKLIQNEREVCLNIKVEMKMLQTEVKYMC